MIKEQADAETKRQTYVGSTVFKRRRVRSGGMVCQFLVVMSYVPLILQPQLKLRFEMAPNALPI